MFRRTMAERKYIANFVTKLLKNETCDEETGLIDYGFDHTLFTAGL